MSNIYYTYIYAGQTLMFMAVHDNVFHAIRGNPVSQIPGRNLFRFGAGIHLHSRWIHVFHHCFTNRVGSRVSFNVSWLTSFPKPHVHYCLKLPPLLRIYENHLSWCSSLKSTFKSGTRSSGAVKLEVLGVRESVPSQSRFTYGGLKKLNNQGEPGPLGLCNHMTQKPFLVKSVVRGRGDGGLNSRPFSWSQNQLEAAIDI